MRATSIQTSTHIIGIDPGSIQTGYGVLAVSGERFRVMDCGVIRGGNGAFAGRLAQIFIGVRDLFELYHPEVLAIERVFVHRNVESALKLGHARAAAICAGIQVCPQAEVVEYAAREVKQAIVGFGAASKEQVQLMMRRLLGAREFASADASDALAIALCHGLRAGQNQRLNLVLKRSTGRSTRTR